jgi:hypothetical protein
MNEIGKDVVLDTDKPAFVAMIVVAIVAGLLLAGDAYRWAHGQWVTPLVQPSGFFGWFPLVMATLTVGWCVATFRDRSSRFLRLGCSLLLVSFVIQGALLVMGHSPFVTTLMYVRPVFSVGALVCMVVWVVSWFKGIVVHD